MPESIEVLLREAYWETQDMLDNPNLRQVVRHGLIVSYGPPIAEPDLLFLSFQGAGNTFSGVQETWPEKLQYLDSKSRFGPTLRELCRHAELSGSLESSAMAFPAVFPQAPAKEARHWMKKTGPYSVWRDHSADWVNRLVKAIRPKVVIVFGDKTSRVFDIGWKKVERNHRGGHQTFGVSTFQGAPAVFCHHLSQSYVEVEAQKCFAYARRLVSEGS